MHSRFGPGTLLVIALLVGALLTVVVAWTHALVVGGRTATGWPAPALAYEATTFNAVGLPTTRDTSWRAFRRHPTGATDDGLVLPMHPVWPGFVIDAAVLGAFAFGAVLIPPLATRRARLARGQCPACRFPMGTSERCTECGASLPVARRS